MAGVKIQGEGFLNGGFEKIFINGKEVPLCLLGAAFKLLEALKIHHENCMRTQAEYSEVGMDRVAYRATKMAIDKAEGRV